MGPGYAPAAGMRAFLSGTPPIVALHALEPGLAIVERAGIDAIRAKGIALTDLAITLSDAWLGTLGVRVASPREGARRGAHVALAHPRAIELCGALAESGVLVDYRAPDVVRLGLSPLTTRFSEVWDGVDALRQLLARGGAQVQL